VRWGKPVRKVTKGTNENEVAHAGNEAGSDVFSTHGVNTGFQLEVGDQPTWYRGRQENKNSFPAVVREASTGRISMKA